MADAGGLSFFLFATMGVPLFTAFFLSISAHFTSIFNILLYMTFVLHSTVLAFGYIMVTMITLNIKPRLLTITCSVCMIGP